MKKIIFIVMVAAASTAFISCGNKNNKAEKQGESSVVSEDKSENEGENDNSDTKTKDIVISGDVDMSGNYSDLVTVEPGSYTLKMNVTNGEIPSQMFILKIKFKRTATTVPDGYTQDWPWTINMTDADGAEIENLQLEMGKGYLDMTESEKFVKWLKTSKEGDVKEFMFTTQLNNSELAPQLFSKATGFAIWCRDN